MNEGEATAIVNEEQRQYVEDFGELFERSGGARPLGRMIAWLLIADPPEQSAEQLAESLHASRGAISQNTRVLVQMGLVQRVRKPGERRDYFRIRPGAWEQSTRERRHETRKYTQLFQRGLALTEGGSPESQRALKESIEFMTFLDQEVDALFERWDQRKGTSS